MKRFLCTITLSFVVFLTYAQRQMRGIWVCSGDLRSSKAVISVLDSSSATGLTDVFLQVRTAGDAAYDSATEPRPRKVVDEDLDVLALACEHGHRLGLRVHAWLNINYCAPGPGLPVSPRHIANRHPSWIATGRDGTSMAIMKKQELQRLDSEGLYLSPDADGLAEYFQMVVGEILRKYPVDGIHLDFIRYANYRFDYGGKLSQLYKDRYGVDASDIAFEKGQCCRESDCEGLELWRRIMNLRWMAMRADALTELVRAIRRAQVATRPDAVLSAAVWFPQDWAYSYVGQDWMRWLDEDAIDLAIPMAYAKNDEPLKSYLPGVKEYLVSGRMAAGLGAWRLDGTAIVHKMEMTEKNGGGWVLFDYGSLAGRGKVAAELVKYIDGCIDDVNYSRSAMPSGWQMGWANRRPLASAVCAPIHYNGFGIIEAGKKDYYSTEAQVLSVAATKAWSDGKLIPAQNELAERVLPWVDQCNLNITGMPRLDENDLRNYFNEHRSRYLGKRERRIKLQKSTTEEIEVAYQKNRDKVYRDAILDKISMIINDNIK